MKRIFLLCGALLLSCIILVSGAAAQTEAGRLEWLIVELWPDYDRPSVLVLLTAALPQDASLPATVTIPLPPDATLNAVARISGDNRMVDDIDYATTDGALTLVTPDLRFRVEYYVPYQADGLQRQFQFQWRSDLALGSLEASVQRPLAATELELSPQPAAVVEGNDGLQYYDLPPVALEPGEPYLLQLRYTLQSAQLTAGAAAPSSDAPDSDAGVNWPLLLVVIGLLLVVLALGWHLLVPRLTFLQGQRREGRQQTVRYCHNCGESAQSGDRFCRACGTRLKRT